MREVPIRVGPVAPEKALVAMTGYRPFPHSGRRNGDGRSRVQRPFAYVWSPAASWPYRPFMLSQLRPFPNERFRVQRTGGIDPSESFELRTRRAAVATSHDMPICRSDASLFFAHPRDAPRNSRHTTRLMVRRL